MNEVLYIYKLEAALITSKQSYKIIRYDFWNPIWYKKDQQKPGK